MANRFRKKITEVEEFYIIANCNVIDVDTLSKKFNISHKFVQKIIDKSGVLNVKPKTETVAQSRPPEPDLVSQAIKAKDLMGKDPSGRYGYSVMTQGASEIGDEHRKIVPPKKDLSHCIHKARS
jgi:hypothetical protein